jgi:hypothetical protein
MWTLNSRIQLFHQGIRIFNNVLALRGIGVSDAGAMERLATANEPFKADVSMAEIDGKVKGPAFDVLELGFIMQVIGQIYPVNSVDHGAFQVFLQVVADPEVVSFSQFIDDVLLHGWGSPQFERSLFAGRSKSHVDRFSYRIKL